MNSFSSSHHGVDHFDWAYQKKLIHTLICSLITQMMLLLINVSVTTDQGYVAILRSLSSSYALSMSLMLGFAAGLSVIIAALPYDRKGTFYFVVVIVNIILAKALLP
ncbi:hypothetical protein [Zooshikella sp. RANM57]|uniref:hypothetical protein n=1 Tax=Zooshikella sp. RANM57 TaxID=3425863 RepID=UPI003D6DF998